jgi:hypothetical protein
MKAHLWSGGELHCVIRCFASIPPVDLICPSKGFLMRPHAELSGCNCHGCSAKKAAAKDSMVRSCFETWGAEIQWFPAPRSHQRHHSHYAREYGNSSVSNKRETRLWTVVETALHKGSSSEGAYPSKPKCGTGTIRCGNALTPPSLPCAEIIVPGQDCPASSILSGRSSDCCPSTGKPISRTAIQTA